MAQRKTKTTRKRGASRSRRSGASPFVWFVAGLVTGLGIAGFALFKGMVPELQQNLSSGPAMSASQDEEALIEPSPLGETDSASPRYDFFTVLPEMEVVVPEQELAGQSQAGGLTESAESSGSYILQAGSFRSPADAEQLKARLALLGTQANIATVTVDEVRWHRVRIGPLQGARKADELRRMLRDNGIETLILKDTS